MGTVRRPPAPHTMRLLTLCLLALATYSPAYSQDEYIHSPGATNWGFWGNTDTCRNGSYAQSFQLLYMEEELLGDNTAANGIYIHCFYPNGSYADTAVSSIYYSGTWSDEYKCGDGDFLHGYDLKSQPDQGAFGDNTAANALRMYCKSGGENVYMEAPGTKWGDWIGPSFCSENKAVCGLMTLLENYHGILGEDTTLNDVRFLCCDLPA